MSTIILSPTEHLLSLWSDFGKSKIDSSQLLKSIQKIRKLREVSIDINYKCNFSCSYCSYGFKKLHKRELTLKKWKEVINECILQGAMLFAIAGKEPLIDNRFKELLFHLKNIKETKGINIISGLITNGWFLEEKTENLVGAGLDYLDVSIDGHQDNHDANRMHGSFKRAIKGLLYAKQKGVADKLFVSSVLHAKNYKDLPSFIIDLYSEGIKNFSISLIYPAPSVQRDLIFTKEDIEVFLNDLLPSCISNISDASDLQIVIDIFTSCLPYLREMVIDGTIDMKEIYMDGIDSLFNYSELSNGCTIYKRFSIDHLVYGKALKITADGYCMADYESLTKSDYWKWSLGNVQNMPISSIYNKLFQEGAYIHGILKNVEREFCPNEPCYPLCLGNNNKCLYRRGLK